MEKTKLTVVTTTYNQEKYIEECIKNIVSQKTNFKFELLISDDCSNDNTRTIISKYKELYPNIVKPIFREKNLGAMGNFIDTLNRVHTEYVALCDGDDYWCDDNKLQKQVDFLEHNKDYSIVFHQTLIFYDDGSNKKSVVHPTNIKSELSLKDLIKENVIPANSVVYRWNYKNENSLINDFPKDIVPGDYYFHLIHANKGKVHFIKKVMSKYRRQEGGMWYLTSQEKKEHEFHLKYGEKYLKFYREVEKKLNLDKNTFSVNKNWIIQRTLIAYLYYFKIKKFIKFYNQEYEENKEIIDSAMLNSGMKVKLAFYFFTNPLKFIKEIFKIILGKK